MKRVTEKKIGKKSVFTVETIIADEILATKEINVRIDTVEIKGRSYHLIYDSSYNIISSAYDFLNHNYKKRANNSIKSALYALRYLYIFSEIIEKDIADFDRNDFFRLNYFLSGVSADGTEFEYIILTKRSSVSINIFFSAYREFYRFLGYENCSILKERTFSRYIYRKGFKKDAEILEIAKFISEYEYNTIVQYIRKNIEDEVRKLRDECIVRIMYEGGCRLGEVLGSTLEDYVVTEVGNTEMCFMYIRNRLTDKDYQNAKKCMPILSRKDYHSDAYETKDSGYQLTFLNMDTYDLICEYIDLAHDRAYKKYRCNYDDNKADAVGEYKSKNQDNYYLFLNSRGEPLSDEGWNKELRKIFKAVGISIDKGWRKYNLSHRFRHGFIMHLIYDLEMKREMVIKRSRHSDEASLYAYYNPTIQKIVEHKKKIENRIL